jgi:TetR/AcrR family transcriptional regulator, transcriptional repressor for nem operon
MRYGPEHKAGSRERIVRAAAEQIRGHGPDKMSVAGVMRSAGLTHGAFYAHFNSKDALVAEAVGAMFTDARLRRSILAHALADEGADVRAALRAHIESYLSPSHRDRPERGCALPALAAEIARDDNAARANLVAGLRRMTDQITQALTRLGRVEPRAAAGAAVARMVGAVALARALGASVESDALLCDCREALFAELDL